jgi:hypothetical protein
MGRGGIQFRCGEQDMPPRGLGRSSCDGDDRVRPDTAGTWLALVVALPSQVWTDRAKEISKLREKGETLASIGQRFGLCAERVGQILLDEGQRVLNSTGTEEAPGNNAESPRTDSSP